MKEIILTMTRRTVNGNAVRGRMSIPTPEGPFETDTLENAPFLIPAGTYPLELTWSPKFAKLLPQIMDVPDREGIRIHRGTLPEHSTGCVLVNNMTMMVLKGLLNAVEKRNSYNQNKEEDEKVFVKIT